MANYEWQSSFSFLDRNTHSFVLTKINFSLEIIRSLDQSNKQMVSEFKKRLEKLNKEIKPSNSCFPVEYFSRKADDIGILKVLASEYKGWSASYWYAIVPAYLEKIRYFFILQSLTTSKMRKFQTLNNFTKQKLAGLKTGGLVEL
jgi:hypothetical protein